MSFPRSARAAVLAAVAIALAGCTSSADEPHQPAAGQSPAGVKQTAEQTKTPAASSPTPPVLSRTPQPTPAADQLLATAQVPGLGPKWHWQDGRTTSGDTDGFGVCAKADLGSIGATQLIERTYFPPDDSDDSAAQQIAVFADAKSVSQAWSVLDSWRARCAAKIGTKLGPKVSAMTPVEVPGDATAARWYLTSWTPAGEETGRFEAIGMIRFDTWISVLRITNSGQDYDYPVGTEPMVTMIKRALPGLLTGFGVR
jgi:hypothetical protein